MSDASETNSINLGGAPGPSVVELLDNQRACWRGGKPILVEAYLAQQPMLADDTEAVLDLIAEGNKLVVLMKGKTH